jgi:Fe2+ transport system protein B
VGWRLRAALKQFLTQAMPVFLGICLAAAFLEHLGAVAWAADLLAPAAQGFHLPPQAVPAVLFSILRKDGLLILNSGEGDMVGRLGAGQVFLVVWLASTLTACLVTLWTVRRELGWRTALTMAGRQAVTSLVTAFVISRLWGES